MTERRASLRLRDVPAHGAFRIRRPGRVAPHGVNPLHPISLHEQSPEQLAIAMPGVRASTALRCGLNGRKTGVGRSREVICSVGREDVKRVVRESLESRRRIVLGEAPLVLGNRQRLEGAVAVAWHVDAQWAVSGHTVLPLVPLRWLVLVSGLSAPFG